MLCVTNKHLLLSVIFLNVVLPFDMLSVIILSVIMLNVIMLSVVAPFYSAGPSSFFKALNYEMP
jgi:hypothetical protein